MAQIDAQARARRDARELSRWEPLRAAGENITRQNRIDAARKAKEDGVPVPGEAQNRKAVKTY